MIKVLLILLLLSSTILSQTLARSRTSIAFLDSTAIADSSITILFVSVTANEADSIDVVISSTPTAYTDSIILILNEADVEATYANADTITTVDGNVTTFTLAHGQVVGSSVRLATAAISIVGDTTALVHETYTVETWFMQYNIAKYNVGVFK